MNCCWVRDKSASFALFGLIHDIFKSLLALLDLANVFLYTDLAYNV